MSLTRSLLKVLKLTDELEEENARLRYRIDELERLLPPGAIIVPFSFFTDGHLPADDVEWWEVWLGGDHWIDLVELVSVLNFGPPQLRIIARKRLLL